MPANNFGFNGFTPMRHLAGGVVRCNEYLINTSGTTGFNDTIRQGDPVKMNTDGTIELAVGGDTVIGVFDGVQYTAADGSVIFDNQWTASTPVQAGSKIRAWVYDDPNITFAVTSDGTTAGAQNWIGGNVDFNVGTGNSLTRRSGAFLNTTTGGAGGVAAGNPATSGTANCRILGFVDVVGNTLGNTNMRVEVRFNEHAYLTATGA